MSLFWMAIELLSLVANADGCWGGGWLVEPGGIEGDGGMQFMLLGLTKGSLSFSKVAAAAASVSFQALSGYA